MSKIFPKSFIYGENSLKPVEFTLPKDTSVTTWDGSEDAFNLKPPILGGIKDFNVVVSTTNGGLYRTLIGLNLASKLENNTTSLAYTMSLIINEGLRQLTAELGDLTNRKITLGQISDPGYFFISDKHAAVEFRIMADRIIDIDKELERIGKKE